ncbi:MULTISPECIES: SDR family NAD(P)-dependent oxidoreductase [Vibrio]|uniref:SDR family oxidoreductase n=2 Tax=Vibrio TaxID=662 RepID=A0A7X4RUY7_9VIBR|nr:MULTISPECIES: SDR family oxidoreductase [Vibrio]MBF9000396.1 SDR family oxidoreductase [Vibrio nitrifigilis]MZI93594.1 SDR family oxidoreductase [Vibrio eleionomae]
MLITLEGKTALVTASTGGIGFTTAKILGESGATVIINGRSQESVNRALDKLHSELPNATFQGIPADLSRSEGCQALIDGAGEIDILVNNAGIYGALDFYDTSDEIWNQYWETNVMSGVRLSRAFIPKMQEKGWGRVVFISSESSRNIPADMIHYGVSKTAQLSLSRGLAKRFAGTGITFNCVLPGPTISDGFAAMFEQQAAQTGQSMEDIAKDFIAENRPSSVLKRAASVEEVANMIVYVCSEQASATSGAALRVDGGVVDDIV